MCLASDEYTFTITDAYGDGICCCYGQGGYVIKVDGTEVVNGGEFGDSETETFTVTAPPTAPVSPPTAPVSPPSPVTPPTGTTPYPTEVPPTPHPTGKAPTPYPTLAPGANAPTPYPTE